jgi:hypothetical protein
MRKSYLKKEKGKAEALPCEFVFSREMARFATRSHLRRVFAPPETWTA